MVSPPFSLINSSNFSSLTLKLLNSYQCELLVRILPFSYFSIQCPAIPSCLPTVHLFSQLTGLWSSSVATVRTSNWYFCWSTFFLSTVYATVPPIACTFASSFSSLSLPSDSNCADMHFCRISRSNLSLTLLLYSPTKMNGFFPNTNSSQFLINYFKVKSENISI